MVLVHKVFRRELRLLPALVGEVSAENRQRATQLGAHYRQLATALQHHHEAERDLLWGRLRERAPLDAAVEQQMTRWHRQHAELMAELDGLLPLWEQSAEQELQAVVVDILTDLAVAVTDHLDAVEELVLPAVDRHFSSGEWLALGLRAASWIPLHRMAWMLGAMLEDATEAERKQLLAKVPGPARLIYRMVGRDQYAREMSAVRGSLVDPVQL
jgi:hemerythrin-like domain-containing protein